MIKTLRIFHGQRALDRDCLSLLSSLIFAASITRLLLIPSKINNFFILRKSKQDSTSERAVLGPKQKQVVTAIPSAKILPVYSSRALKGIIQAFTDYF